MNLSLTQRFMGGAHRQGELDDVPLGGGRFPAVLDRLDIDVAYGLQVIAGEVFDEGLAPFGSMCR